MGCILPQFCPSSQVLRVLAFALKCLYLIWMSIKDYCREKYFLVSLKIPDTSFSLHFLLFTCLLFIVTLQQLRKQDSNKRTKTNICDSVLAFDNNLIVNPTTKVDMFRTINYVMGSDVSTLHYIRSKNYQTVRV